MLISACSPQQAAFSSVDVTGAEYHVRVHDTTKRAPRDHFLADVRELRPVPPGKNLDDVFLHRKRRKVRKDGTVRWQGGYLEVRADLTGDVVELRFDPNDASVGLCLVLGGVRHDAPEA